MMHEYCSHVQRRILPAPRQNGGLCVALTVFIVRYKANAFKGISVLCPATSEKFAQHNDRAG
jgi:hypothetical protein